MREIKFRAWDKKFNLMIQPDSTMAYDTFIAFDGTVHELGEWSGYSGGGKTDEDVTKNYILMQYTGLNDKNGKEIYEGDVIDQHRDKCVIKRCVGGFDCKMIGGASKGSTFIFSFLHSPSCEVIGNIYENAELLEVSP